jgi:hypothetical protein
MHNTRLWHSWKRDNIPRLTFSVSLSVEEYIRLSLSPVFVGLSASLSKSLNNTYEKDDIIASI